MTRAGAMITAHRSSVVGLLETAEPGDLLFINHHDTPYLVTRSAPDGACVLWRLDTGFDYFVAPVVGPGPTVALIGRSEDDDRGHAINQAALFTN